MSDPHIGSAYGPHTGFDLAQAHIERLLAEAERSRAAREAAPVAPLAVEGRPRRRHHRLPALHHA